MKNTKCKKCKKEMKNVPEGWANLCYDCASKATTKRETKEVKQ